MPGRNRGCLCRRRFDMYQPGGSQFSSRVLGLCMLPHCHNPLGHLTRVVSATCVFSCCDHSKCVLWERTCQHLPYSNRQRWVHLICSVPQPSLWSFCSWSQCVHAALKTKKYIYKYNAWNENKSKLFSYCLVFQLWGTSEGELCLLQFWFQWGRR